ncbi:LUD domain-containing protein [Croceimicrobium sp.]|uniref:LUD domain-containing protein n=1 Tax=Croceimicrobium sp. TaxID=2828340 RepID=UPI003BAA6938
MAEQKSKKGLLGRFMDILSGRPTENSQTEELDKPVIEFTAEESDPTDLGFVKKFTASGGKFLYCEDEGEAFHFLRQIMEESGLGQVYCTDPNLISILRKAEVNVHENDWTNSDAFCTSCEYLVSFNGGIMISANQLHGKKLEDLPETFITIGRTSQITDNLRSALAGIRVRYKNNLPSQITTIKGPKKVENLEENDQGKICNKEIYLLLLEDQL